MATGDSISPGPSAAEEPLTVEELFDEDAGRWQITTQTSIYLLDLDRRTLLRTPGAAGDQGFNPQTGAAYPVNVLQGDRQPQPIWIIVRCRVGERMYVYTNADATGVTLRVTTPLNQIRRLPTPEAAP